MEYSRFNNLDIEGRYIFLDNDFLSFVFEEKDALSKLQELSEKNNLLMIDYFVKFEFLREVFIPEKINLKENFVSDKGFNSSDNNFKTFEKLQENAIFLSKLYAHQKQKTNYKGSPGLVDLFLASRLMMHTETAVVATGNIKDFPATLFDIIDVWNVLQQDGAMRTFGFLKLNKEKFNRCVSELDKLENKK